MVLSEPRTYVACLECGKELPYDWQTMRRIKTPRLSRTMLSLRRIGSHFRLRSASWATCCESTLLDHPLRRQCIKPPSSWR